VLALSGQDHWSLLEVRWKVRCVPSKGSLPQENTALNFTEEEVVTTKYQDAASIVGDSFAAKLDEYERKLREKKKSEAADALILKSQARRRAA